MHLTKPQNGNLLNEIARDTSQDNVYGKWGIWQTWHIQSVESEKLKELRGSTHENSKVPKAIQNQKWTV